MEHIQDIAFGAATGFPLTIVGLILGPAYSNIRNGTLYGAELHLSQALEQASAQVHRRSRPIRRTLKPSNRGGSGEDDLGRLVVVVVVGLIVVRFYTLHRGPILWVLFGVCCGVFLACVASIIALSRNDVLAGRGWSRALLWGIALVGAGLVDIVFLVYPAFHADYFSRLLSAFQHHGQVDLAPTFFVGYQVVGAVAFVAVALSFLSVAFACISAGYLGLNIGWQWFWRAVYRLTSINLTRPGLMVVCTFFVAVMSLVCTSGALYRIAAEHLGAPTTPTQAKPWSRSQHHPPRSPRHAAPSSHAREASPGVSGAD
jgi:hypothetical protein